MNYTTIRLLIVLVLSLLLCSTAMAAETVDEKIQTFANNAYTNSYTSEEILNFLNVNQLSNQQIYFICLNEPSQSVPSLITDKKINDFRTDIFNRKLSKEDVLQNVDLLGKVSTYQLRWMTDFSGREYLIIYSKGKPSDGHTFAGTIKIILMIVACLVLMFIIYFIIRKAITAIKEHKKRKRLTDSLIQDPKPEFQGPKPGLRGPEPVFEQVSDIIHLGNYTYFEDHLNNERIRKDIHHKIRNYLNQIESSMAKLYELFKVDLNNFLEECHQLNLNGDRHTTSQISSLRSEYTRYQNDLQTIQTRVIKLQTRIEQNIAQFQLSASVDKLIEMCYDTTEILKQEYLIRKEIDLFRNKCSELRFTIIHQNVKNGLQTDFSTYTIHLPNETFKYIFRSLEEMLDSKLGRLSDNFSHYMKDLDEMMRSCLANFDNFTIEISNIQQYTMSMDEQRNYFLSILKTLDTNRENFNQQIIQNLSQLEGRLDETNRTNFQAVKNQEKIFTDNLNQFYQTINHFLQLHDEAMELINRKGKDAVKIISDKIGITIINEINKANQSIDLSIYNLTEMNVLDALIKKVHLPIRIVTDEANFLKNVKTPRIREQLLSLVTSGVVIKRCKIPGGHMHRKEIIIDGKVTLSGSANFSNTAFNKSIETIYIFDDTEWSRVHEESFLKLWDSKDTSYVKQEELRKCKG